jgi:sugar phosphate isomerase/epimerase
MSNKPQSGKNSGMLVDSLHFDRSKSTIEQLDALPPSRLTFVHLCDAPAEQPTTTEAMIFTARAKRLVPEGPGLRRRDSLVGRMDVGSA